MEKEQFLKFKEDLKKEAQQQREVKRQRKTVKFQGERAMSAYDAQLKCKYNKRRLDLLYTIYYILKHRIEITPENLKKTIALVYPKTHSGVEVKIEQYKTYSGEIIDRFYVESNGYYEIESFISDVSNLYKEIIEKYEKIG